MRFDIFSKLQEEITEFDTQGIWIVGKSTRENEYTPNSRRGEKGGYFFSQKEMLEAIDLACASKYKKGIRDEEGQLKTYLNIVNFYRDVTKMKIDINAASYIMEPTDKDFIWPVWLMDREFKQFAQDESYDDEIDDFAHDLATYGTCVGIKAGDCTERVPVRTIRNTQGSKSLMDAALNGGYVLIENEYHYTQMKKYKDWNTEGLSKNRKYQIQMRLAMVPEKLLKDWKESCFVEYDESKDEMVPVMAILAPTGGSKESPKGRILFMEKIDEKSFPLEECRTGKVDGRWLGVGEVEKQLENQVARNLTANLRRRGILWATKNIYQSTDDEVQKNLVMEVKDGEVLKIKKGGEVTKVNTQSQHLTDFSQDEASWKENSQQVAFAFNIATGENMPANTPFRLGVVLSEQVTSHFKIIRSTFSNFLKRSFFDQLVPIFKDKYSYGHTIAIPIGASSIENLKESMLISHFNDRMWKAMMQGKSFDPAKVRQDLMEEMNRSPYLFIDVPEDFYKHPSYYMRLNIVDDISTDVTDLTTLYQAMAAKGDPRAEEILRQIFAKKGKTLPAIVGPAPEMAPTEAPQSPQQPQQPVNPQAQPVV